MGVRGASTFPLRNRLPCPVLWSKDLVLIRVRFPGIPFPYGINILVATLIPFFAVATAGDSAGDVLSKSILAFVCFILLGVYLFYVYILYICLHVYFLLAYHVYFCLHIMHMDYILCSLGSSVLFCRWGVCVR